MNAVEIDEAITALAGQPFDAAEFPFSFLQAFGNNDTAIRRLRTPAYNKSDLRGVLQSKKIHIATCNPGEVTEMLVALKASPANQADDIRFTGKPFDPESGLYYFGARYYDPKGQVWISPDPILDQYMAGQPNDGVYSPLNLSLNAYGRMNPIRYVDPDGEFTLHAGANIATGDPFVTFQFSEAPVVDLASQYVSPLKRLGSFFKALLRGKDIQDKFSASTSYGFADADLSNFGILEARGKELELLKSDSNTNRPSQGLTDSFPLILQSLPQFAR